MTPVGVTPRVAHLTCWTCGLQWEIPRRSGAYPNRCLHCTSTETSARRLLRTARTLGLEAQVDSHPRHGYVCVVKTPWHGELVIVRDEIDLRWMLAEHRYRDELAEAA